MKNLQFNSYSSLNDHFIRACYDGDFNLVKSLYNKYKPTLKSKNKFLSIGQGFFEKFKKEKVFVDIHYYDDRCFRYACEYGHLDIAKYLLTSEELVEKSNLYIHNDYPLISSCRNGHLGIVQFLLSHYELDEHRIMQQAACFIIAKRNQNWDIVNFLIFDQNMAITPAVEYILNNDIENREYLTSLFNNRELKKKLLSEIEDKPTEKKRKKI